MDQIRDHNLNLKEIGDEIIEVRTLDSFVDSQRIDKIDIMKIGVEGVEKEVLLGRIEILKKKWISYSLKYHSCEKIEKLPIGLKSASYVIIQDLS